MDPAPTPYTARQIREATSVGRRYEWRVETPSQVVRRVVTFTRVSAEHAELQASVLDEQGAVLEASHSSQVTWEELRRHAEFPRSAVTIDEAKAEVPAGAFDCLRYTLTEGSGAEAETSTFYFAKTMPGAPVLFFTEKGGQRVMTSTLVAYAGGG